MEASLVDIDYYTGNSIPKNSAVTLALLMGLSSDINAVLAWIHWSEELACVHIGERPLLYNRSCMAAYIYISARGCLVYSHANMILSWI